MAASTANCCVVASLTFVPVVTRALTTLPFASTRISTTTFPSCLKSFCGFGSAPFMLRFVRFHESPPDVPCPTGLPFCPSPCVSPLPCAPEALLPNSDPILSALAMAACSFAFCSASAFSLASRSASAFSACSLAMRFASSSAILRAFSSCSRCRASANASSSSCVIRSFSDGAVLATCGAAACEGSGTASVATVSEPPAFSVLPKAISTPSSSSCCGVDSRTNQRNKNSNSMAITVPAAAILCDFCFSCTFSVVSLFLGRNY